MKDCVLVEKRKGKVVRVLVICADYEKVKSEMNRIYKGYESLSPVVNLTERIITISKINYLFIFKTISDYPERIMGIEESLVWIDEPAEVSREMFQYLKAHTRKEK